MENGMREKYETILDLGDLGELKATEAQQCGLMRIGRRKK
jgi:hypothetical protein